MAEGQTRKQGKLRRFIARLTDHRSSPASPPSLTPSNAYIDVANRSLDEVGAVVAWLLNPNRATVLQQAPINEVWIGNTDEAIPIDIVRQKIGQLELFGVDTESAELILIKERAAQKVILMYAGHNGYYRVKFTSSPGDCIILDFDTEMYKLRDNGPAMRSLVEFADSRRQELRDIMTRLILPEFDRLALDVWAVEQSIRRQVIHSSEKLSGDLASRTSKLDGRLENQEESLREIQKSLAALAAAVGPKIRP